MNRNFFLITAILVSLTSYGFSQTLSFKVAGVTRTYLLHAPTTGLSNPPLVFMLHGRSMDGTSQEDGCKFFALADREKFIVAYPNAISGNWDVSDTSKDLTFILAIIDSINAKYHIDRNRVYVAGFSQGAAMCHTCGCVYSDVFAAIAPTSGGLNSTLKIKRSVPMFMTFGTKDLATPATYMTSVAKWVQLDSCSPTPVITRPYPVKRTKSLVTRLTYGPNKDGTIVVADSIYTGSHEWPMDTNTRVNNSEEVWAFFKQFSLPSVTGVGRKTVSLARVAVSASYSSGIVRINGIQENCKILVMDTEGRLVTKANIVDRQFVFKNKQSGAYMVVVSGKEGSAVLRLVVP